MKGLWTDTTRTSHFSGQGTLALEIFEDVEEGLDAILISTCGGGMLAGCSVVAREMSPGCKIIPVEPEGKFMRESLLVGKRLWGPYKDLPTKCEALKGRVFHLVLSC